MGQAGNWRYVLAKFIGKYRFKFGALLGGLCLVEIVYVVGISLLPPLAVILLQTKQLNVGLTILVIFISGVIVYGIIILDLFLQQRLSILTFDFRFDYVPVFSEHIFGWDQRLIDSVAGKTVIDQAYEAIYRGGCRSDYYFGAHGLSDCGVTGDDGDTEFLAGCSGFWT